MSKKYDRNWKCKCQRIEYSTYSDMGKLIMEYWDHRIPFVENDWEVICKLKQPKEFETPDMYQYEIKEHQHNYCNNEIKTQPE